MPEWITAVILKIFGSEKAVKLMFTIVIWAALVMLIPESFALSIADKSGIPYSGQVVLFAAAFVIAEIIFRLLITTKSAVSEVKVTSGAEKALFDYLSALSEGEKQILKTIISSGEGYAWLNVSDNNVISLSQKRVITCIHTRRVECGVTQMGYRINDKYLDTARRYFGNLSRR